MLIAIGILVDLVFLAIWLRMRWQEIRARVLREQPRCEICGKPATDVDHVRAVADGGPDDRSNLRALCNPCHEKHTAEQNRARRRKR